MEFKEFKERFVCGDDDFWNNDEAYDYYECSFMNEVSARLLGEYQIDSEPSTEGGGTMGADFFFLQNADGETIADCQLEINDEREWMFEIIAGSETEEEAISSAVETLEQYCSDNWEYYNDEE